MKGRGREKGIQREERIYIGGSIKVWRSIRRGRRERIETVERVKE